MIGTTFIEAIETQCRIGCKIAERRVRQSILIDITCETDMASAIASDERRDCVDYCDLHRIAITCSEKSTYRLLEKLAHEIGKQVLAMRHVQTVTVRIRKPNKLENSRAVGISLTLKKDVANGESHARSRE